jgi:hypothetical protein
MRVIDQYLATGGIVGILGLILVGGLLIGFTLSGIGQLRANLDKLWEQERASRVETRAKPPERTRQWEQRQRLSGLIYVLVGVVGAAILLLYFLGPAH